MNKLICVPRFLLFLVVASFLPLACSSDTVGVFYSLENEEKAKDNSLPNSVRMSGGMFKYNAINRYYVGTGSVFYRDSTSDTSEWIKIKNPIAGAIVTGLQLVGTDIFVSLTDGTTHGLYKLDPTTNYTTYITSVNYYSAYQITRLFCLNGNLFAQTGTELDPNYELFVFNGSQLVSTGISSYIITAGAWDGTNYWFITDANQIFKHTAATGWSTTANQLSPTELASYSKFTDIFVDPDTTSTLYICNKSGYLFRSADSGATWTVSDNHGYALYSIGKISDKIVMGISGIGVVELGSGNNINSISTPGGNYDELPDLYDSTVLKVFVFGKIIFACTASSGIWRGDYSSSMTSPVWSQE